MADLPVVIAGGGIGGLSVALTLQQIGVPCLVLEAVAELKPLGVGINLQPNAVRELYDLDIGADRLDAIGLPAREWALVGLNGKDVYSEPRGLLAGYRWPQYAVHRGGLQMLLHRTAVERLDPGAVLTGHRVVGYRNEDEGVTVLARTSAGTKREFRAKLLIAADGLHSAARAQMHPQQPPIHWGGAIMWRGMTPGAPIRSGASFVGLGSHRHRVVFYPISRADPGTGLAMINWIAEITVDTSTRALRDGDWNKEVAIDSFIHHFEGWRYDWLDVPAMLRGAGEVFEYPMIDRDPVDTWVDGRVALLGDAAHVMYPTGSNGASQAIIDARVLGAALLEHGVTSAALQAYDRKLCAEISAVVLRNRGAGPFGLLNLLDERCGGVFDDIDAVIPAHEREEFMSRYRAAAGFAKDRLNAAPPTIAPDAKVAPL
jgi:5-methylphenazine-1-carboxylate 1-monooxygenase